MQTFEPSNPLSVRDPEGKYTGNPQINAPDYTESTRTEADPMHDIIHSMEGIKALNHPVMEQDSEDSTDMLDPDEGSEQGEQEAMTEDDLLALIKTKVESSHQWYSGGSLTTKRIDADKYYRGEPLGNEIEGRSQVVSRDVAEVVDGAMPSMMRVFAGGEQVCTFDPFGPDDEEKAKQATDYVNHIFMSENEGFMILYTWFKDGFLKKNGIVKAWHETRYKRTKENYQGLTQEQLQAMQYEGSRQIQNVEPYQETITQVDPVTGQPIPTPITLFNVTTTCTKPEKKICVENVPPDEFIIERRATSIYTTGFIGQRGKRTISDLIELGYDKEKVMSIPAASDADYTTERLQRFNEEEFLPEDNDDVDPSMRKVWVTDIYVKCDYDGDGIAEWRHVVLAGDGGAGNAILANEEVDDHIYADLTPDPEPHKFYGQSLFDKTKDIQEIKTALIRGILDSTYLANSPRIGAVEGQVNMDDLLDSRPGGVVRLKSAGALVNIPNTLVSGEAMQVVQYVDAVKERRSGIKEVGAGLDPNILNSTATGADIVNNNNQQRLELMCRIFAESGVKRLFRIIFKLVCQYQDVPKTVRLRGKWVEVDPRDWKDRMDVSASVGIGLGSKTQQAMTAKMLLEIDQQIIQMQGGVDGPIVKLDNVYNKLCKLVEAAGWKTPDPYYTDPKDYVAPPPKPPTPEQQVHMKELESKSTQAVAQADAAKAKALADIETRKLDFEMRKIELAIKRIEYAALRYQNPQQIAVRADNEVPYSEIPNGGQQ